MKKIFISFIFICLILGGCNNPKNEELKWFNSQHAAIQNGLKEEGINKKDIISNYEVDGELFIIYKKEENMQLIVGLANIASKDGKYRWYRNDAEVNVKAGINARLVTKNIDGKEFLFYTGKKK